MDITEIKNNILIQLKEELPKLGFHYYPNKHAPLFSKPILHGKSSSFFLNFKSYGAIAISELHISIDEIESVIKEVGLPNSEIVFKNNTVLSTIKHNKFLPNGDRYEWKILDQADLLFFKNWLLNYLNTKGFEFVEHYSFLPNVLAKMNQLIEEGKYWGEILSGSDDNLFRGLIISKLCNDNHFDKKMEYVEKIFKENPDEWLPYFEKLKEKLKTIEPKYNAEDGRVLNFEDIT